MNYIEISDKKIGNEYPTYIIAEAGLNHDGDVEQAKELVSKAMSAGADMVKFQIFLAEELCSRSSKNYDLFSSLELSEESWREIAKYAREVGIEFSASVFGNRSADLLDEVGGNCFKIASGDLTYDQLLNYVAKKGKPIILSTGMAYMGEVERAINIIREEKENQIALLHCVSNYPTAVDDVNLRAISTLSSTFNLPVGFSDHTIGNLIPTVAIAMGASIIEKHFTLSHNLPGPDHKLSMTPVEFREMVSTIRNVEAAMGDGLKRPIEKEMPARLSSRRSLTAANNIDENEVITAKSIKIARPGTGLGPELLDIIIGRSSKRKIPIETPIVWEDI